MLNKKNAESDSYGSNIGAGGQTRACDLKLSSAGLQQALGSKAKGGNIYRSLLFLEKKEKTKKKYFRQGGPGTTLATPAPLLVATALKEKLVGVVVAFGKRERGFLLRDKEREKE